MSLQENETSLQMYVGVKTYCSSPGGRMVTSNKHIQSSTTSFEFLDKLSQIKLKIKLQLI